MDPKSDDDDLRGVIRAETHGRSRHFVKRSGRSASPSCEFSKSA
jgi:hypothetical protein